MKAKYCGLTPFDQYNINEFLIAKNANMRKQGEYDEHCNHIHEGSIEKIIPSQNIFILIKLLLIIF